MVGDYCRLIGDINVSQIPPVVVSCSFLNNQ